MRIIIRADSGFCRQLLLRWCERNGVSYIIGMARNKRLEKLVAEEEERMRLKWESSLVKQRVIGEVRYAAGSWNRERRLISRLEYDAKGNNPRFVVTNLEGDAAELYEQLYCKRGEAENRIKEVQLDLFGTRASCHKFAAMRILLAALAYTLMERLRALALVGAELERACSATIRVKLLKFGAAIVRNTRRVRLMLSSSHPFKHVFLGAAHALAP